MTPEAEELLRAGRESFQPSDADRARVFESLSAQIGDAGLAGGLSTTAKSSWLPLSAAVVGLGLLGGGLYLALSPEPAPPSRAPAVVAAPPVEPPPAADDRELECRRGGSERGAGHGSILNGVGPVTTGYGGSRQVTAGNGRVTTSDDG